MYLLGVPQVGIIYLFMPKDDLYVWSSTSLSTNLPQPNFSSRNVTSLATVAENEKLFTKREVAGAKEAREFLRRLCFPAPGRISDMIRHGHVLPISTKDLMVADELFGKPVPMIQGKTVAKKVKFEQFNPIPKSLISSTIEVQCDIFLFMVWHFS